MVLAVDEIRGGGRAEVDDGLEGGNGVIGVRKAEGSGVVVLPK